jgi:hypothetical protein
MFVGVASGIDTLKFEVDCLRAEKRPQHKDDAEFSIAVSGEPEHVKK